MPDEDFVDPEDEVEYEDTSTGEDDAELLTEELELDVTGVLDAEFEGVDEEDFVSCLWLYDSDGTPWSSDGHRDYDSVFKVIVADPNFGPVEVVQAPCVPRPYSPYVSPNGRSSDLAAVLVSYRARREHTDDWQSWIVTCHFSTRVPDGGVPLDKVTTTPDKLIGTQNQPWLERPTLEWDEETENFAPQYDLDGRPYRTSAKMPFSPAQTFSERYPVLVITRNQQKFNDTTSAKYENAVNSQRFLNNPAETCQCISARGRLEYRGTVPYYRCVYRIRIKTREIPELEKIDGTDNAYQQTGNLTADGFPVLERETWQPLISDAGLYQLGDRFYFDGIILTKDSNTPVPITAYGHPVTQPVLLDGKGKQLAPGSTTKAVWLKFRQYEALDLNKLLVSDNP